MTLLGACSGEAFGKQTVRRPLSIDALICSSCGMTVKTEPMVRQLEGDLEILPLCPGAHGWCERTFRRTCRRKLKCRNRDVGEGGFVPLANGAFLFGPFCPHFSRDCEASAVVVDVDVLLGQSGELECRDDGVCLLVLV